MIAIVFSIMYLYTLLTLFSNVQMFPKLYDNLVIHNIRKVKRVKLIKSLLLANYGKWLYRLASCCYLATVSPSHFDMPQLRSFVFIF